MLSVNSIPIFAEFLRTSSHTCAAVNMQCDLPVNTNVPEPANSSRAPPFPGNSANSATVELHRLRTIRCRSSDVWSIVAISLLLLMTRYGQWDCCARSCSYGNNCSDLLRDAQGPSECGPGFCRMVFGLDNKAALSLNILFRIACGCLRL